MLLTSRRHGVRSNHQLPQTLLDHALRLIHERYADFGPPLSLFRRTVADRRH
jgi:hypothetical protein